ncbi:response regulator [Eubacteriales bacterium OttesenSCG-928-A19]|nr:response regulator [Eubacteriales bacterium OttesenSCG-928-A19]
MRRIGRVSIGARMALAFGTVLALLLGVMIYAVSALFSMSALVDGFYFSPFRVQGLAHTVQGGIQGVGRGMLRAIVTEDMDEIAGIVEETRALMATVRESLAELQEGHETGESKALIDELTGWFEVYSVGRDRTIALIEQGDFEGARRTYIEEFSEPASQASRVALLLCEQAEHEGYLYMATSNENALRQTSRVIIIIVSLTLLAVVLSVWIVRSITRPVHELRQVAEQVSEGNLKVRVDYRSADELGALANSMRKSMQMLSAYIGEIDRSLTALGSGNLSYRASNIFTGDFVAIRQAIEEITGLLRAQREMEARQRGELKSAYELAEHANRSKSDFLSSMSHDIRTPMNAIIGMTAIAMTNLDDTEKVRQCLRKISLSSKHLLGLINDVLDMSKIESGRMTLSEDSMSLPEVMENIVNITQPQIKAKRQNFAIRLHGVRHELLYCDALRINQVFINILSNAVKFTPVGGTITVDVTELASDRPDYGRYAFEFTDSGRGMSEAFVRDIFTAFSRETAGAGDRTEGTGLGMAISKKIVDLMEGDIRVESELGRGSRFTVELYLRLADTQPEEMRLPEINVLLVDDDPLTCETAAEALREIGMTPEWVDSGEEAVRRAGAALRRGVPYDVVIIDWQMPGMDGVATARAIREVVGPDVSILVISAYDWSDIADEARAAGVDGFISKPLFKSTLYYGLRRFVTGEERDAAQTGERETLDFTGRNILLVEDNEINREIAQELLAVARPNVVCAENGCEAVARFDESPEGYFDVILMDVQMPVMDGYEATRQIRALHRADAAAVPILAMTANAFSEDIEDARRAGMDHHIAKPLDPVRMLREIARFFSGRAGV